MPQVTEITNCEFLMTASNPTLNTIINTAINTTINTHVAVNEGLPNVTSDWFEPSYWVKNNAIIGQSQGRSVTYFFQFEDNKYALRHYCRGGLIGKLIYDQYLYVGLKQSRVYKEFALLEKMQQLNLPAPKPIGAQLKRQSGRYTANIVMQLIPNAQDLFQWLLTRPLNADQWHRVGQVIAQFHQQGIYHADLNIHNLMIDNKDKIWLIDFDRGEIKTPHKSWQTRNLNRLLKSLNKEKTKQPAFYWQPQDWALLIAGYENNSVKN